MDVYTATYTATYGQAPVAVGVSTVVVLARGESTVK